MGKNKFWAWVNVGILVSLAYWVIDGSKFSGWYFALLAVPVLFSEIVIKILLLQGVTPVEFASVLPSAWPPSSLDELSHYTQQLKDIGFTQLEDYTLSTDEKQQSVARLFSHPQAFCFAEIGLSENMPMFCSISGHLEGGWNLGVTNMSASTGIAATSHAFLRLPRRLAKCMKGASVELLFATFLDWRKQVSTDLQIDHTNNIQAEDYFANEKSVRNRQRNALTRKSIIWSLIEMWWFTHHPKTEWLGAYKAKSAI